MGPIGRYGISDNFLTPFSVKFAEYGHQKFTSGTEDEREPME